MLEPQKAYPTGGFVIVVYNGDCMLLFVLQPYECGLVGGRAGGRAGRQMKILFEFR